MAKKTIRKPKMKHSAKCQAEMEEVMEKKKAPPGGKPPRGPYQRKDS